MATSRTELESEYLRDHLRNNRTVIRVACVFFTLVAIYRVADQTIYGALTPVALSAALTAGGLVLSASVALLTLAWSAAFERFYLPVARVAVPLKNAISAAAVVAFAAQDQLELLMLTLAMVLGPFFFLGLQLRVALVSAALTLVCFAASALYFELPQRVFIRSGVFLLLTVIGCAIGAHSLNRWSRRSFLEARRVAELAQHDAVTDTKNRRVFDEHLKNVWRQAIKDRRSLAIAVIDVDHFKAYNDRYGHQAGDQALRRVAQTLQGCVSRPLDLLARYGGEEFAVLLYDIDDDEVADLAQRMRAAVAGLGIEHRGSGASGTVTVSIGVAVLDPTDDRRPRGALQLADEALYEAKKGGRNRVVVKGRREHRTLVTGVFAKMLPGRG